MTRQIRVNIGSGNGMLPDGTKPLPGPKLSVRPCGIQLSFTGIAQDIFSWYRFENRSRYLFLIQMWKSLLWYYNHISQGPVSAVIRAATYQKRLQRPSLSIVVSSNCGSVLQRKREAVRFPQQRPVVRKESHANVSSSWTWCVARNLELGWLGYIE